MEARQRELPASAGSQAGAFPYSAGSQALPYSAGTLATQIAVDAIRDAARIAEQGVEAYVAIQHGVAASYPMDEMKHEMAHVPAREATASRTLGFTFNHHGPNGLLLTHRAPPNAPSVRRYTRPT